MNVVDVLLQPKSFCFFLTLRTGCYIIAMVYLLSSLLITSEEFESAIYQYTTHIERQKIGVLFVEDLTSMTSLIFTLSYIHGLQKKIIPLIFCGIPLVTISLATNVFSIIVTLIVWTITSFLIWDNLLLALGNIAIEGYSLIIVSSYYKQVAKENKRAEILPAVSTNRDFHEVENPNFSNP